MLRVMSFLLLFASLAACAAGSSPEAERQEAPKPSRAEYRAMAERDAEIIQAGMSRARALALLRNTLRSVR